MFVLVNCLSLVLLSAPAETKWAEIRVTDSVTGRGVPLVELETVHGVRFVTDNAGRVALLEPGLMGRELFLSVRGHGYLAGQIGGTSHLGAVWYAEADAPTGPFARAVKVASHDRQTFDNVSHHAFYDRDGGRPVHFEGTYTNEFSGNAYQTPRYNYNQILYRLDLDRVGR